MKKIFAILALFLAFSISANAQENKPTVDASAAAKSDFEALNSFITIEPSSQAKLIQIFKAKHEALSKPGISANEKKNYSGIVAESLSQELTPQQSEKLRSNTLLYRRLTR